MSSAFGQSISRYPVPRDYIPAEIIGKEFGVFLIFLTGSRTKQWQKSRKIKKFVEILEKHENKRKLKNPPTRPKKS